ncbi:MAG: hypothetical protein AAF346_14360 [Pseudomonadota bacterium]
MPFELLGLATVENSSGRHAMVSIDKKKHKTHTNYWWFESAGAKEAKKALQAIPFAKTIAESVLNTEIKTGGPAGSDAAMRSFPIDPAIVELRAQRLCDVIHSFLDALSIARDTTAIAQDIETYDRLFHTSPIQELGGGMGYNNGLVLFCFARATGAKTILESGVWKGFTTYLLDNASADDSQLFCYDINLSKVEWRSSKAQYFEDDLTSVDVTFGAGPTLAMFDDHVSQYDRLVYAHERNFEFLIFDDDVSHLNVHSDGWPPVPSINMIWNKDQLPQKFQWMRGSSIAIADISQIDREPFVSAYHYVTPPDLFEITGYRNTSQTSYLVRK